MLQSVTASIKKSPKLVSKVPIRPRKENYFSLPSFAKKSNKVFGVQYSQHCAWVLACNIVVIFWCKPFAMTYCTSIEHLGGSPPTGLHFGPILGSISGSLFKQARCKIFVCVLYYSVMEQEFYKKSLTKIAFGLFRQFSNFSVGFCKQTFKR